ncbi:hypothetical protein ACIBF6_10235 [Streptosporangium amethystogenes]|uniref:hypothetical protein n=1 Tax=Streptosporangium amethystogenes TaxID=2002 RepID=UPI0037A4D73B
MANSSSDPSEERERVLELMYSCRGTSRMLRLSVKEGILNMFKISFEKHDSAKHRLE